MQENGPSVHHAGDGREGKGWLCFSDEGTGVGVGGRVLRVHKARDSKYTLF